MLMLKVDDTVRNVAKACGNNTIHPSIKYMQCNQDYVVATDGYVCAIAPATCDVNGECKYVEGKKITQKVVQVQQENEDTLALVRHNADNQFVYDEDMSFPDIGRVLEQTMENAVEYKIGMTGEVLKKLADVIGKDEQVVFEYRGVSNPMTVSTEHKYIVAMPRELGEDE